MRKLVLILIAVVMAFNSYSQTEETKADLYNLIDTELPSASSITAAALRAVLKDMVASPYNILDDEVILAQFSDDQTNWHAIPLGSDLYARYSPDGVIWSRPALLMSGFNLDLNDNKVINLSNPIDPKDAVNLQTVDSLLEATKTTLKLVSITDPAINEATSTAIIDTSQGVLITLTGAGNDQALQQPTITTEGREFHVMNSGASTSNINVNGYVLEPFEHNDFIYDGTQWIGNNITSQFTLNLGATGWYEGGELTGIGLSTFSIAAGDAVIIDNTTNHEKPDRDNIVWPAINTITITNLASADRSYIGITRIAGVVTVIQQISPFSSAQLRSIVRLGIIAHIDNATVTSLVNNPVVAFDRALLVTDLVTSIGNVNEGNVYSGINATANLFKTAGITFREGANALTDSLSPNKVLSPETNPETFVYAFRDGSGGIAFNAATTTVSGALYDDGTGTPAATPSNKFTNQRKYFFPSATTNLTFILLGQNLFSSLSAAVLGENTEPVEIPTGATTGGSFRSTLSIKNNFTTFTDPLSDASTYTFVPKGKFGETSAGGTTSAISFAQVYLNSLQPQIPIDGIRGALQIKSTTGDDADNIQEWIDNLGVVIGMIDGNGKVTISGDMQTGNVLNVVGTSPRVILNETDATIWTLLATVGNFSIRENGTTDRRLEILSGGNIVIYESVTADTYGTNVQTLTETAGAIAWNMSNGSKAKVTIDQTSVITITNMVEGAEATIRILQGDAGDDNVTFVLGGATVEWRGDDTDLTDASGAKDYISIVNMDGVLGVTLGSNYVNQ